MGALPYQKLAGISTKDILEELAKRGIDARAIKEFSMTEINNEITRRRMIAEQAEIAWEEEKIRRL